MKLRTTSAVLSLSIIACTSAFGQDGGALYKTKCAGCHGDQGQGKGTMAPKVAGSAKVETVLTKGGEPKAPHIKPMASVTPEQAAALASYVKALK